MSEKRLTEAFFFVMGLLIWGPLWWYLLRPWSSLADASMFWWKPVWMPAFPVAALVLMITSRMGTWTYHPKMGRIWPLIFAGFVGTALAVSHSHLETWTGVLGIILLYYSLIALQWRKVNYQGTYLKAYRPWLFLAAGGTGWGLAIVSLGIFGIMFFPFLILVRWWRTRTGPGISACISMAVWALLPIGGLWLWWIMGLQITVPRELWEAQWIWEQQPEWSRWGFLLPFTLMPFLMFWLRGLGQVDNPGLSGAQTDLTHWMASLEWVLLLMVLLLPGYLLPFCILFAWSAAHRAARVLHHLERGELHYHRAYRASGLLLIVLFAGLALYAILAAQAPVWPWWPRLDMPGMTTTLWMWIAAVATSAVAGYTLRACLWKQKLWETGVWVSALIGWVMGALLVILLQSMN